MSKRKPKSFKSSHGDSKNLLHFQSILRRILVSLCPNSPIFLHQHLDRIRDFINPKPRMLSSPSFHRQGMGHSINQSGNKKFFNDRQRVPFHQQTSEAHVNCKKQRPFTCPRFSHERKF
ncbi:hypothetical protein E1A91_A04G066700v1 [Gossypium mustelinum]|uniref:Uncharacterized protein n=1 Tax=Gossypium mustelinum TaxID=34275 RepID=A0A5D2ZMT6_GOSMU|nr:hypothetical protein E1A91_A04G066700v1 [Gossypium mustelinum]